ncbi:uncharacterized protein TRIADDRAFT_24936 [Trichoplax adhaerens]|uniref:Pan3 C-terminal knob domain-containing protein n=1 Tax=Trichoplax adhaerens TaxID=10228 RepID=B3RXU2_TRIAD|nr:hypothetical protein TRIADDRAFT_24936 [Trichoplax adhaerens]EDV24491.1 hypothetical protein TRIADDRAFT_24936 [Trichoplax adhaerens]|eukprot:XP_002112381.1 hypothetical protein TRIADDRAFT_24936 [Trichoplax adhaerens]
MAPHSGQEGNKKPTKHYFMNHNFKQELLVQRLLRLAEVNPDEFGLPREVKHYNSLYPLEMNQQDGISSNFGYRTICFKAINSHNGQTYLLRRVIGSFRASQSTSLEVINKWKKIKHSGIVQLHEVFTTKAFGDNSLIAIYDYYPANETMQSHYFDTTKQSYTIGEDGVLRADVNMARNNIEFLDENIIWKYVIQLTSALRLIHVAGLACQILNVTKVLVASRSRLRINGVGILDILGNDSLNRSAIASRQMTDLTSLGRLLLALACRSLAALDPENYSQSLDFVANNYSSDLRDLIFGLLTCQQHMPQVVHKIKSVNDVMPLIGARFYTHINDLYFENDILEVELENELENDRLVRLLLKLGIVNDRPEFFLDGDWSETGDRYLLKLFRDYIFHQVKQDGSPWIDMAHMIQCLNKLDVGSQDRICLSSRDEKSVLVVSYKDLRDCFERTINEVFVAAGIKNPARG